MNAKNQKLWDDWVASRPPRVREVAERFSPNKKYRIKNTGQPCQLYSFSEPLDGGPITMKVIVQNRFGPNHLVFGLDPNNIEEVPHDTVG
jgi:hypothetical protein